MSSIREKMNEKQYRWVKEEFRPFRERHAIKITIIGIFIIIASQVGYMNIENYPEFTIFYYFTAIIGIIIFVTGIILGLTGFKMLYKLDEVNMGKIIVYQYVKDSKSPKQIFESVSDAEMYIENPEAETEEEEDLELEPIP